MHQTNTAGFAVRTTAHAPVTADPLQCIDKKKEVDMFLRRAVANAVPASSRSCARSRPRRTAHGSAHLLTQFIKGVVIMASVAGAPAVAQSTSQSASTAASAGGVYNLIIGTYTGGKSEGLYVYRFDTQTGDAQQVSVAKTVNPSFLAVPRLLNYIVALYLIIIGIIGLFGAGGHL